MDNATIFYVIGPTLAVSAVVVSFIGLRVEKFPGRFAPLVFLWFAILVGGATTFAVLHSKDEQKARASRDTRRRPKRSKKRRSSPVECRQGSRGRRKAKPEAAAKGPGGTLELAADPTQIALRHDHADQQAGQGHDRLRPTRRRSNTTWRSSRTARRSPSRKRSAKGKTSVSADLAPGTYTFLCTVPGHAEAGMEGTLTVK